MVVSPKATFCVPYNRLAAISAAVVTFSWLISVPPVFSKPNNSLTKRLKTTQNSNFTFIIQPKFTSVSGFSEGLASVYIGYRKAYINNTGKVVIPPVFKAAGEFSEGLAWVNVGEKWGYINKNGELVIKPQFDLARDFSQGIALVKLNGKWGYINKTGKFVIKPQFDNAMSFVIDKQSKVANKLPFAPVKLDDKWGYIDKSGNFVIKILREKRSHLLFLC